jgi:hypothetical protein
MENGKLEKAFEHLLEMMEKYKRGEANTKELKAAGKELDVERKKLEEKLKEFKAAIKSKKSQTT